MAIADMTRIGPWAEISLNADTSGVEGSLSTINMQRVRWLRRSVDRHRGKMKMRDPSRQGGGEQASTRNRIWTKLAQMTEIGYHHSRAGCRDHAEEVKRLHHAVKTL